MYYSFIYIYISICIQIDRYTVYVSVYDMYVTVCILSGSPAILRLGLRLVALLRRIASQIHGWGGHPFLLLACYDMCFITFVDGWGGHLWVPTADVLSR
jgi:hypothetical protein